MPEEGVLVSFDVQNLFPSVPIKECQALINDIMIQSKLDPQNIIDLNHIFSICLHQNYFVHNEKIYQQLDGLAMGSPISPLCADVFMNEIEEKALNCDNFRKHIHYWYRYVDDVLCLWTGSKDELDEFLIYINSINSKIKFTMEIGYKSINFLDLNIKLSGNKHNFKIYRKDTFCDNIIPADSNHPVNHKYAAFNAMINRLVSIPQNKNDYKKELDTIKTIAYNNGYKPDLIDLLLKKKQKKVVRQTLYSGCPIVPSSKNKKYARLPFLGKISYKCSKLLQNYRPAFYNNRSLKNLLFNNKPKVPKLKQSGVYKLECDKCKAQYVGQTGRCFSTRIREHSRTWYSGKGESAFGQHLRAEGHDFEVAKNFTCLHRCNKGKKLDALEALEINKRKNEPTLLNDRMDLNNSPLLNIFN